VHDQVEIAAEDGVLRARFSGVIGMDLLPQAAKTFEELAAACATHGCSGILLDTREVDLRIDRTGVYHAGLALARVVASRIPVAAVVDPAHVVPDDIFSRLAGLAGAIVAVFVDEPKALAWLDRARKRPARRMERARPATREAARSERVR
jgi:hypothetical protein